MNLHHRTGKSSDPGTDNDATPRPGARSELIGQMHALHQTMQDTAETSSPLAQHLVGELRADTYQRLAPMVYALDGRSTSPAPESAIVAGQAGPARPGDAARGGNGVAAEGNLPARTGVVERVRGWRAALTRGRRPR